MKAAIDIGTNTVLLLVAEAGDRGLNIVKEEQHVPRLGQGVDRSGRISDEAASRVIATLKHYKNFLASEYPNVSDIYVTATSAVRDAQNQSDFLQKVAEATEFNIRLLSGHDEARLTFMGALSVLDHQTAGRENLVIDIGGGSTELAFGRGQKLIDQHSFDMGCVRFTERFLKNDPPEQTQIEGCRKAICQMLDSYTLEISGRSSLIAVAGTATSLAFIDKEMETYKSSKLAGHTLTGVDVSGYVRSLSKLPASQLKKQYPVIMEGRADIFFAGLLILEQIMKMYNFEELTISTGGIRHGVIIDSLER